MQRNASLLLIAFYSIKICFTLSFASRPHNPTESLTEKKIRILKIPRNNPAILDETPNITWDHGEIPWDFKDNDTYVSKARIPPHYPISPAQIALLML